MEQRAWCSRDDAAFVGARHSRHFFVQECRFSVVAFLFKSEGWKGFLISTTRTYNAYHEDGALFFGND